MHGCRPLKYRGETVFVYMETDLRRELSINSYARER